MKIGFTHCFIKKGWRHKRLFFWLLGVPLRIYISGFLLKMTVLKKRKMHEKCKFVDEFEWIRSILHILVRFPLWNKLYANHVTVYCPNFQGKCPDGCLSYRHLPFYIDITFTVATTISQSLISSIFVDSKQENNASSYVIRWISSATEWLYCPLPRIDQYEIYCLMTLHVHFNIRQ